MTNQVNRSWTDGMDLCPVCKRVYQVRDGHGCPQGSDDHHQEDGKDRTEPENTDTIVTK